MAPFLLHFLKKRCTLSRDESEREEEGKNDNTKKESDRI